MGKKRKLKQKSAQFFRILKFTISRSGFVNNSKVKPVLYSMVFLNDNSLFYYSTPLCIKETFPFLPNNFHEVYYQNILQ